MNRLVPAVVDLDEMLANSFRDFHVKGFDYLCLRRSPERTVKAYFFDGDVSTAPEVVMPHDHRYAFLTTVAAGSVVNRVYHQTLEGKPEAQTYERFDYLTPLNGGSGFAWRETCWLAMHDQRLFGPQDTYAMRAQDIHTIRIAGPETILVLDQGPDVVDVGVPTSSWRPSGQRDAPVLDGLYSRMDSDHALKRLRQLTVAIARSRLTRAA